MFSQAKKYKIYTSEISSRKSKFLELRVKDAYSPKTQEAEIYGSKRLGRLINGTLVNPPRKDSKISKLEELFEKLLTGTGVVPAQIYDYVRSLEKLESQPLDEFLEQALIKIVQAKLDAEAQEEELVEVVSEETTTRRKNFLAIDMLKSICEEIGLIDILESSYDRKTALQILSTAMFLVMTESPIANINNFLLTHDLYSNVSEDTCARLFTKLVEDEEKCQDVSKKLYLLTGKDKVVGFDTTTVSTYSDNLEAEYGLNKDGDGLKTVKLQLTQSLTKNIPIQFELQRGHIPDVNCIDNFITRNQELGIKDYEFVGDRGFSSQKNIETFLESGIDFTCVVSASNSWVRKHLHAEYEDGKTLYQTLMIEKEFAEKNELVSLSTYAPARFTHKDALDKEHMLHFHFFVSPERFNKDVNDIIDRAQDLVDKVNNESIKFQELTASERRTIKKCFHHYVDEETGKDLFYYKKVDVDTLGLFCIVSTLPRSAEEALKVYGMRNQIEETFRTLKNNLDGRKPRTGVQERLHGKTSCQFFGLIITSTLRNVIKLIIDQCQANISNKTDFTITESKEYEKLLAWLKNQSLHNILEWYDSIDIIEYRKIDNNAARNATRPDTIKRDNLFLKMFEEKLKEYASTLDVESVRIKR